MDRTGGGERAQMISQGEEAQQPLDWALGEKGVRVLFIAICRYFLSITHNVLSSSASLYCFLFL